MKTYLCSLCNDDADGRTFIRWQRFAPTLAGRFTSAVIWFFGGGHRVRLCAACAPKNLDAALAALRTPSNPRQTHARMEAGVWVAPKG